jgi:hypothetical protein
MCNSFRISVLTSAALMALSLSGSLQAQQAGQAPNMTFFLSSTGGGNGGALGGLEGADALCQRLAGTVGAAQGKTWHAYLSSATPAGNPSAAINARDRIGKGPWQNSKGAVIATSVDDLHSDNNKLSKETALTERGTLVAGVGDTPTYHDIMTGSQPDGRAWPPNLNLTCNNWTSSTFGNAQLGHSDRRGLQDNPTAKSWNSTHSSRSCTQDDLRATGGNGLIYCFAVN